MTASIEHASEQAFGEVFTRRWVVDALLDLVGYTSDRDLASLTAVEPSAGSGAFLVPMVERLLASASSHGRGFNELQASIRAWELQSEHAQTLRAAVESLLNTSGATLDEARRLSTTWIVEADFLLADADDLFSVSEDIVEADFVIGNPPYIRFDDLEPSLLAAYRSQWTTMAGRGDIYVGFFERGLSMLRPGGKLGFICADRWMRNAYGSRLRALVSDYYAMQSVWQMHDVDAFETDVSAYPAITVMINGPQADVAIIDTTCEFGPDAVGDAVAFTASSQESGAGIGFVGARLPGWFKGDDLWPAGSPVELRVIEDLNERFLPIEHTGGTTRVGIGVATGADKAYLVDPNATDVEPDRLTPLVMAQDISSGWLEQPRKALINPWDDHGRLVDIDQYPRMAATLAQHPSVAERFVVRRKPEDWYRTIDKVNPTLAAMPKLLLQDMKAQITPVLEPGGFYPHHNLYYIVSTGWDLEVLGGLLLSRIAQSFVAAYGVKMRGGTLRFQAQYLRKIRVPNPETIPRDVAEQLRCAFRSYDRDEATRAAEIAYGLPAGTF